ncbi:KTSC domain-containing protein [Novosphingobium sp. 9]|uniref:KTSC domain-containing protein n=1 Tax=Novosphingobium sp. 9 TaxID=2025349 RepID=UPI0021B67575|nr:KTSC domain-containing protein [Novosphingobium sp. 9]
METYDAFESSNIASLKYDSDTLTLQVSFHNGSAYQYFDVPQQIWEAFKLADSKGVFLNAEIKGTYRYSKV